MASRRTRRNRRMQGQVWTLDGDGVKSITLTDGLGAWQSLNQNGSSGYSELGRSEWGYAQAYIACGWAKRAIDIRVQKVSELLRKGKVINIASGQEVPDHPLKRAFDICYREYEQEPFEEWEFSKSTYGETYVELVSMYPFGVPGPSFPATVRVLNALAIEPIAPRGKVEYYDYSDGYENVRFERDEIALDKFRNPFNDVRGLSLLAAALDAVNIDRSLLLVTRSYLKNNARPGLIFTPKSGTLQAADKASIATTVKERVKGPTNAGKPLLFEVPLDVTVVNPPSFEDQDILTQQQKERICAVIGVPVSLVTFGDMKYQLSPEQRKGLYTETIIPEGEKIAKVVDVKLLPFFDPSGQTKFTIDDAVSDLLASLEDPGARATVANSQLAAGGISLNEYRQVIRQPALPNGDVFFIPPGLQMVPTAQIGTLPTPPAPVMEAPVIETPALPASALEADKDVVLKSLCIMLDLAGDVNLIDLQSSVKRLLGDTPVRWNDAAEFHCTLFYAPSVTDAQVESVKAALQALDNPDFALRIGSLNTFDNLGEYAVHFRIRQNSDLLELQESLYDLCVGQGIQPSTYSLPDVYKPHITMGYAESKPRAVTFMSKIAVEPHVIILAVGDDIVWRSSTDETEEPAQKALGDPASDEEPAPPKPKREERFGFEEYEIIPPAEDGEDDGEKKYDPSQPRRDDGKFGSGGGSGGSSEGEGKPKESDTDSSGSKPRKKPKDEKKKPKKSPEQEARDNRTYQDFSAYPETMVSDSFAATTPKPSDKQAAALDYYRTNAGAYALNRNLRTGGDLSSEARAQSKELDSFLGSSTLAHDTTVYRGISPTSPQLAQVKQQLASGELRVGSTMVDHGYSSTTMDRGVADTTFAEGGGVMFKINAPKGSNGAYVSSAMDKYTGGRHENEFRDEKELLLPRGSNFRITNIRETNGQYEVEMTYDGVSAEAGKALTELAAWEKKTLNKGATKALDFTCNHVDSVTADYVRMELALLPVDAKAAAIREVFADAADVLALKAYGSTRDGFYDAVLSTIRAGQAEEIKRRNFGASMRVALRRFGLVAFRDGLSKGGYPADEGLTPAMATAFRDWLAEQSGYVTSFGAEVFGQGIADTEVEYRASLWTNKSLDSIYYRGLALAAPEKKYRWQLGNTIDHCDTCAANHNQVKTMAEWVEAGLPRSHALDCGGWKCDCSILEAE